MLTPKSDSPQQHMDIIRAIENDLRERCKTNGLKNFTIVSNNMPYYDDGYVTITTSHIMIRFYFSEEIWRLMTSRRHVDQVPMITCFSVYNIDLDQVLNEIVEAAFFPDKIMFAFGPTLNNL